MLMTYGNVPRSFAWQRAVWALCVLTAVPAFAANADEDAVIEEVVVTAKSIKASQMAAIEAKRMTDNVADIISADAIGRFPDQNLADALGRVPGVSIERDQGQARYISFRGAPKRYTTTAFNGIEIPGVENGRICLLYTSPSPRDRTRSRMPSSA